MGIRQYLMIKLAYDMPQGSWVDIQSKERANTKQPVPQPQEGDKQRLYNAQAANDYNTMVRTQVFNRKNSGNMSRAERARQSYGNMLSNNSRFSNTINATRAGENARMILASTLKDPNQRQYVENAPIVAGRAGAKAMDVSTGSSEEGFYTEDRGGIYLRPNDDQNWQFLNLPASVAAHETEHMIDATTPNLAKKDVDRWRNKSYDKDELVDYNGTQIPAKELAMMHEQRATQGSVERMNQALANDPDDVRKPIMRAMNLKQPHTQNVYADTLGQPEYRNEATNQGLQTLTNEPNRDKRRKMFGRVNTRAERALATAAKTRGINANQTLDMESLDQEYNQVYGDGTRKRTTIADNMAARGAFATPEEKEQFQEDLRIQKAMRRKAQNIQRRQGGSAGEDAQARMQQGLEATYARQDQAAQAMTPEARQQIQQRQRRQQLMQQKIREQQMRRQQQMPPQGVKSARARMYRMLSNRY